MKKLNDIATEMVGLKGSPFFVTLIKPDEAQTIAMFEELESAMMLAKAMVSVEETPFIVEGPDGIYFESKPMFG